MRYALLGVEGTHDQAAVGKLLKIAGLQRFNGRLQSLNPFWKKFVPVYPHPEKQSLYERLDMPSIYETEVCSVAVYQGQGSSNLIKNLKAILTNNKPFKDDIDAFGLVDRKSVV